MNKKCTKMNNDGSFSKAVLSISLHDSLGHAPTMANTVKINA